MIERQNLTLKLQVYLTLIRTNKVLDN